MIKIRGIWFPLAAFACFGFLLISCGETVDLSGGDSAQGQVIYDAECASCHAADGSGNTGPSIVGVTASQLQDAVRDGPGAMDSYSTSVITDDDLKDLWAYIQTF